MLADSGATVHVTNSERNLFNKIKDRSTIVVGTGKETKALAQGDVIIHHPSSNQLIKLKDVLLVPEFKQNIMSIPALLKNNFQIQASENQFEIIQKNNTISLEKDDEKNMFYLKGKRIPREQINAYSKEKKIRMDINHAHDIFNHMSEQVLRQTCLEHNIHLTGKLKACPGCLYAKAKRKKIMKATNVRATAAGERLFIDTSGPYPRSIGGNKYWFKIVDDYSRKNWNYLMKRKSEVPTHLKSLIRILQGKGKKVKYIRCDNAGEHEQLKKYCEENNIILEMTAPNTPQHNGVVERSFETDLNCIRAMLYQASFTTEMATKLWGMALLYLQQTRNMTSTMANKIVRRRNTRFNNGSYLLGVRRASESNLSDAISMFCKCKIRCTIVRRKASGDAF